MRSSGTPSRTASITRRTTARTSSSGSDADTTRVAAGSSTPTSGTVTPMTRECLAHGHVGPLAPGESGDDGDRHTLAERAHQRGGGSGQLLGEVEHDGAEVVEQRHPGPDGVDRGVHQVALVVPLGRQPARARRVIRTTSAARATRAHASASSAASSIAASSR